MHKKEEQTEECIWKTEGEWLYKTARQK